MSPVEAVEPSQSVGAIVHEMRESLNEIRGFAELLAESTAGPLNPLQAKFTGHILRGTQSLIALVDDVLDVSGWQGAGMPLDCEPIDLAWELPELVKSVQSLAHRKSLQIQADQPALFAFADRRRFRHIMLSLLSNAIEFTDEGGQIQVSAIPGEEGGVIVKVWDTGTGIPENSTDKIFDLFYRTTEQAKGGLGTGLWLAIAKLHVEAHGGRLYVRSRCGDGTEFSFTLPGADSVSCGSVAQAHV